MVVTDLFVILAFVPIGVVLCILPESVQKWLAQYISLGQFGIRTIERRHDKTDTLGNIILFLCLVFCVSYWLLPEYFFIIYSILFWISFVILCAQVFRISQDYPQKKQISLILSIYVMCVIAYCCAAGFLSGHQIYHDLSLFLKDIHKNPFTSVLYYLQNYQWASVILTGVTMMYSFYLVWAQFKYMRLENSFKADNIIFFWIKVTFVSILSIALGYGGYVLLAVSYHI